MKPQQPKAAPPPTNTIDNKLDEILIKSYRYFNGLSVWNLEARIPEALMADKAAINKTIMEDCLAMVGKTNSFEGNTGKVWIDPEHLKRQLLKKYGDQNERN